MKRQFNRARILTLLVVLTHGALPSQAQTTSSASTATQIRVAGGGLAGTSVGFAVQKDPGAIGVGYDGIRGRIRQQCVARDISRDVTTPLPSNEFGLKRMKSRSDLRSTTSMDVAASFGFGMFSGSASYSTYTNTRQSNFSHVVLLRSTVGKET